MRRWLVGTRTKATDYPKVYLYRRIVQDDTNQNNITLHMATAFKGLLIYKYGTLI